MKQLVDPKGLIEDAKASAEPMVLGPQLYPLQSDPARAWLRLSEVKIPASAPLCHLTDAAGSASIDLLRTRLLRQMRKERVKRLALTAPTAQCGTSLLCASLALSLSKHADLKVMLFDLNLRNPGLAYLFGLTAASPRQSAFNGNLQTFEGDCLRVGHNLALCLSTEKQFASADTLGNRKTADLLAEIEQQYAPDVMLFDMPPVLPNDDVVAAADLFEVALLVVRADFNDTDQIDRAERLIGEQKPCLGVVMNACRFPDAQELGDDITA